MREMIVDGVQLVEETTTLSKLTLKEGAKLTAPEGKYVQLTVDGVGRQQAPGTYQGEVVLTVAVVAILVTAPLGALAIDLSFRRLLRRDRG